jgi:hypothetical protein
VVEGYKCEPVGSHVLLCWCGAGAGGGVWLAPLVGKKLGAHQAHMQTSVRTHARCRLLTIGRLAPEAGSCEQFCLAHGSIDAARARRVCCRGWREA